MNQENAKVDIWQIACILYTLMYFKSPFQPGERLAQINANVKLPNEPKFHPSIVGLLSKMFLKNPKDRLSIGDVWSIMDAVKMQRYNSIAGIYKSQIGKDSSFLSVNMPDP